MDRYGITRIVADSNGFLVEYVDNIVKVGGAVKLTPANIPADIWPRLTTILAEIIQAGLTLQTGTGNYSVPQVDPTPEA